MAEKIATKNILDGRKDVRTDRGKTVYPLQWRRVINIRYITPNFFSFTHFVNRLITAKIVVVRYTILPFVVLVIVVDIVGLVIDVVNIFGVVESLLYVGTVLVLPVECTTNDTN